MIRLNSLRFLAITILVMSFVASCGGDDDNEKFEENGYNENNGGKEALSGNSNLIKIIRFVSPNENGQIIDEYFFTYDNQNRVISIINQVRGHGVRSVSVHSHEYEYDGDKLTVTYINDYNEKKIYKYTLNKWGYINDLRQYDENGYILRIDEDDNKHCLRFTYDDEMNLTRVDRWNLKYENKEAIQYSIKFNLMQANDANLDLNYILGLHSNNEHYLGVLNRTGKRNPNLLYYCNGMQKREHIGVGRDKKGRIIKYTLGSAEYEVLYY